MGVVEVSEYTLGKSTLVLVQRHETYIRLRFASACDVSGRNALCTLCTCATIGKIRLLLALVRWHRYHLLFRGTCSG